MRNSFISLLLVVCVLAAAGPVYPYTYRYNASGQPLRWPTNTISVALSTSLSNPPGNVAAGTNVMVAAQRALQRWALAANVQFNVTQSNLTNVSASGSGGDGVSLITIADQTGFVTGTTPGRTRVFTNAAGQIIEADIALNSGAANFSSDGTNGTYDVEATLTHEIGHLLGLDHSGVVGATMQPRQGQSFAAPGLAAPAMTMRTLEDDDLGAIRSLYGARTTQPVGALAGRVTNYGAGAHVWAENFFTGRIHGSAITKSDGSYDIQQLPPGNYRVVCEFLDEPVAVAEIQTGTTAGNPYAGIGSQPAFQTIEAAANVAVAAGGTTNVTFAIPALGAGPTLRPAIFGVDGVLIASPTPLAAGRTFRLYVGGFGLENVPATGYTVNTPFIVVDPASYRVENSAAFGVTFTIVSFNIRTTDTAKFGDFSLRLQRPDTGEISYLSGALAIDPFPQYVELNPVDRNDLFVRFQYLDFLSREPEAGEPWTNVLNNCSNVYNNPSCDRVTVSSSFFGSPEFRDKGLFVYRFYKLAYGTGQPPYTQFVVDLAAVTGTSPGDTNQRRANFASSFIQRPEFGASYGSLNNTQFVNTLMDRYALPSITTPNPADPVNGGKVTLTRADLLNGLNGGTLTRAQVVRAIAESDQVFQLEFNNAFVYIQYVGYLRRDPDAAGYQSWLNYLAANPTDFRTMVRGFVDSPEYRSRFGQPQL